MYIQGSIFQEPRLHLKQKCHLFPLAKSENRRVNRSCLVVLVLVGEERRWGKDVGE
jgi:hypothetical protein